MYYCLQIQEFRTGATKQNMEVTHIKEENKKLMKQISDQKGRLADLEARVSRTHLYLFVSKPMKEPTKILVLFQRAIFFCVLECLVRETISRSSARV